MRTGEAEIEHRVDMTFSQTMFFSNFRNQIGAVEKIPDAVEWEAEPGGICLKGEPSQVEEGTVFYLLLLCLFNMPNFVLFILRVFHSAF